VVPEVLGIVPVPVFPIVLEVELATPIVPVAPEVFVYLTPDELPYVTPLVPEL